jgi:hypothetical protein
MRPMTRRKSIEAREHSPRDEPAPALGDDVRSGALRSIDRALRGLEGRRLVPSAEVVDLLLDLRSSIALEAGLVERSDELQAR